MYINTWQLEGYHDAKAAILTAVLQQLHQHERFGTRIRKEARKLLRGINAMRLLNWSFKYGVLPAAAAATTGDAATIPQAVFAASGLSQLPTADTSSPATESESESPEDLSDMCGAQTQDEPVDVRTFRRDFAALLRDATIKTLVVLIDDLDRCSPDRIIENLEAVKLFLSVDRTAFVIGADRRIVEHAIRCRYVHPGSGTDNDAKPRQAVESEDRLVRDYLEKIVQVPYSIPRLSAAEIETYMTLLFCRMHLCDENARLCVTAARTLRNSNRYAAFGYGAVNSALSGSIPGPLASHLTLGAAASPLMADGLKGNPRQVKRFLNALMLRKELARVSGLDDVIKTDTLVKLMILEYVEPDLFLDLFNRIDAQGHVALLDWLENRQKKRKRKAPQDPGEYLSQWTDTWTMRWATMSPALADLDLRDYFWVTRDHLASTFSGITMVPPVVRTVIADFTNGQTPGRNRAVATAATLGSEERAAMYRLLEQEIAARPSKPASYEPLRALVEADVEGAAASLARVLTTRPPSEMPGAVGLWILNLHDAKSDVAKVLQPAIDKLRVTETTIGKAISSARR